MAARSSYHQSQGQIAQDKEWIEAAKSDPARFEPLYNKYHEAIFRFVYQRLNDQEQAFDVTSQVFLKALTNLHRYEFRGLPFSSWLFRIAISEVNKLFKQNKAKRTVNIDSLQLKGLLEEMESDENEDRLRLMIDAIAGLKPEELTLVEMRFFEQRPFKEIADILQLSESNAKVRLYRILERLRKRITAKLNRA
ncbi:MAG: RNA polymerase sigma factor [Salibacteraceae bacterium]